MFIVLEAFQERKIDLIICYGLADIHEENSQTDGE